MSQRGDRSGPERGSAMIGVLLLLMGVLVMGFFFFRSTFAEQRTALARTDEQRAFFLAEAGLHEAFESIREGNSGRVASLDQPAALGGGVLWVVADSTLGNDRTRLVSTAMVGRGRQALEAVVHFEPERPPLFVATLNSKETLTLNEGVVIDSFDSAVGTYASQAVNEDRGYTYANPNGDVRSNEDVVLNARATVFGDATPGPGGQVTFATGSFVSGSVEAASEPFDFPPIDFPAFTPQGDYAVAPAASSTLPSGNYDFDAFSIGKDATLTITGPANVVVDSFTGGKTANLRIDARGGPVTFYVRGAYTHTSGFNCDAVDGSPMALAFLVDGKQDIVFPSSTRVRGAYYAPNANILFASSNECWGAFAANRLSMSNDMRFHFDESLLRYWSGNTGDDGDRLTVLSWSKTGVTPQDLLQDRRDPMLVLGLERADLPTPGAAWLD